MGFPHARAWPSEFAGAAALLLRAREFAESFERSPWDFAVEMAELRQFGLSRADLRWLVCQGFVEHAAELSATLARERTFTSTGQLIFGRRTCFILTDPGRSAARHLTCTSVAPTVTTLSAKVQLGGVCESQSTSGTDHPCSMSDCQTPRTGVQSLGDHADRGWEPACGPTQPSQGGSPEACEPASGDCVSLPERPASLKPKWDPDLNRLLLGDCIVKEYRTPAPNQQLILSAFQEEGWPPRIDDPLPPVRDLDPKRRLHETIISLNRHQRNRILRFSGDGRALGVRWEVIPLDSPGE